MHTNPRTYIVSQNHPLASDEAPGTEDRPLRTIARAAALAHPGDTVLVREGVYRERVSPARGGEPENPIRYAAVAGEEVVVKGSDIFSPRWERVNGNENIRSAPLDSEMFGEFHPFRIAAKRMPAGKTLGQVFVDGEHLSEVTSDGELAALPGTWKTYGDSLFIHFPTSRTPVERCLVEISVRERLFAPELRGLGHIEVRGFVFEHCANQFPSGFWDPNGSPQAGAVGCGGGHHWVIEHNIIRWVKSIGIDCGVGGPGLDVRHDDPSSPGWHLIQHNRLSDCGACGIAGAGQRNTKILYNHIERTNNLGWSAPETGGIKVHYFHDGLIEGNVLLDNECAGIWLDNVWYGSRVTRNVILNSSGCGIFVEMGDGPCLVDNNIVAFTNCGEGIYLHDSSGVTIAHNLLYCNAHFGVYARIVTERQATTSRGTRETVGCGNLKILNNLFVDNYRGAICLPPESDRAGGNVSDYNLFLGGSQWQWEGLAFHRFVLGTNDKRIPVAELGNLLRNTLKENRVPEAQWPNIGIWESEPYLTLDLWRMLTGHDLHSIAPEVHTGVV
ncbi:MAG: right-handed parallel beta-helix repeat-containing protein, partial [Verrucomicrobiota bacterium]